MERYSILPHMETVFDREARRMPAPAEGREAVLEWQREARAKLWELLSLNRFEACAPNPVRLSSETRDGYRVERMEMETEPNVRMPFYVLIPDGASPSDRRAAFIVPHGHGGASERTIAPDGERDVMALSLVKRGYLVFAPDARGSGDRREFMDAGDDRKKSCSHGPLNNLAIALGYSVCGMEVWDLMRLADYALSRPDADGRLGAGRLLRRRAADAVLCRVRRARGVRRGGRLVLWLQGIAAAFAAQLRVQLRAQPVALL